MKKSRIFSTMENGFIGWVNEDTNEMELKFPAFKPFDEVVKFAEKNNVTGLRIGSLAWKKESLDDLRYFPKTKTIILSSEHVKDFSGLNILPNLTGLHLAENIKVVLDLSIVPKIKELSFFHKKNKIKNLEICQNLETLSISDFKPKEDEKNTIPSISTLTLLKLYKYAPKSGGLEILPSFSNLKKLSMHTSNIESLIGINKFQNLEDVMLYRMHKLIDINNIGALKKTNKIRIENAKNITNHDVLGLCESLENLSLINCGEMKDVDWVTKLKKLRVFNFYGTNVASKDLTPLYNKNWESINFSDKRGYSHKLEEIDKKY